MVHEHLIDSAKQESEHNRCVFMKQSYSVRFCVYGVHCLFMGGVRVPTISALPISREDKK